MNEQDSTIASRPDKLTPELTFIGGGYLLLGLGTFFTYAVQLTTQ